jgi:hypothetical protein
LAPRPITTSEITVRLNPECEVLSKTWNVEATWRSRTTPTTLLFSNSDHQASQRQKVASANLHLASPRSRLKTGIMCVLGLLLLYYFSWQKLQLPFFTQHCESLSRSRTGYNIVVDDCDEDLTCMLSIPSPSRINPGCCRKSKFTTSRLSHGGAKNATKPTCEQVTSGCL